MDVLQSIHQPMKNTFHGRRTNSNKGFFFLLTLLMIQNEKLDLELLTEKKMSSSLMQGLKIGLLKVVELIQGS